MSEQDSMVEKVAAAIRERMIYDHDALRYWMPADPRCAEDVARAAISALRTPTEAMIEAHIEECAGDVDEAGPDKIRSAWQAMIDAGLQEQT